MPSAEQLDRHEAQPSDVAAAPETSVSRATDLSTPAQTQSHLLFARLRSLRRVVVPLMLVTSSMVMALAWLWHLKYTEWPFAQAMFICWLLVLPEYFLNIVAIRLGYRVYSGAQMAAFRLCSGVVCVALVSAWVVGETLSTRQLGGFALMIVAMALISVKQHDRFVDEEQQSVEDEQLAIDQQTAKDQPAGEGV
jgi:uncharacterized protein (DUF486 family)